MLTNIIEIARGMAALWVFSYHLTVYLSASSPTLASIASLGHLGVPTFFVISGYCMMASAQKTMARGEAATTFLYWRFLRIYPAYWFSIIVVVLIPFVLAGLSFAKSGGFEVPVPRWGGYSLLDWVRIVSLAQVFHSSGDHLESAFSSINSVYWTLAIEFQFYLVIYVALVLRRHFGKVLVVVTACGAMAALYVPLYNTGLFLPYWPMFAVGIVLERIMASWPPVVAATGRAKCIIMIGLAALLVTGLMVFALTGTAQIVYRMAPHLADLVFSVVSGMLFWLVVPINSRLTALAASRWAPIRLAVKFSRMLGTISYSLYLLHGKLYQLPFMFVRQFVPTENLISPLLTILATIALTFVFYRFCERPFLRSSRKQVLRGAANLAIGRQ